MTFITGPKLDQAAEVLRQWYLDTRARLIEALEEGYPYGTVLETPQQQLDTFFSMTPADWEELAAKLQLRYRGQTDVPELVRADIKEYITRMTKLAYGGKA